MITDRVAGMLKKSVASVCPPLRFHFVFRIDRSLNLSLCVCVCVGHDYGSPEIESQGHKSRSKINQCQRGNAVGLTSILNPGQFLLVLVSRDTMTTELECLPASIG